MSTSKKSPRSLSRPSVRIGLPYSSDGELAQTASALGASTLLSAGSFRRRSESKDGSRDWRWTPIGFAAWKTASALDSAGFVAMMQGGYRWDVSSYVEFVVTNSGDGSRPFPWEWWSAMDYCCEPEIATDRDEVLCRVKKTIESFRETLEELDYWKEEGVSDVPDPLPILQGRRPEDYLECARALAEVLTENGRSGLPVLVGIGSVCRRELYGEEGLFEILDVLHKELPESVRLHLFGVKGDVLPHLLERYPNRVESVDSMAWDFRARKEARAARISNTTSHRSKWLSKWYRTQERKIDAAQKKEEGRAPLRRPVVYRDSESELGVVSYQAPEPLLEECRLRVERTTRARARALVRAYHRHLPKPPPGEKAAFVVLDPDGVARGASMIGRPSSRALDKSGEVLEITRTATDGSPNACSALVAACVRYAKTEGFSRVVTYTLQGESGSSLRGAGFRLEGETSGGTWSRDTREREERSDLLEAPKLRWVFDLSTRSSSSRFRPSQIPSSKTTDLEDLWKRARPVDPHQIGRKLSAQTPTSSSRSLN